MRRVLFVDDEPRVLEGLQRMLRPMRREWEMSFAEGGPAALELLRAQPPDVVVSDMRMPGMDGAQFLAEVQRLHPQTVRIVLSGHSDQEMIMKSVGPAHQFLAKPCTADSLRETVGRACALRDLLENDSLQKLVSQIPTLPTLPTLYTELLEEIQNSDASIKRVGEIISRDIGMTAKILQLVNSAFFGLRRIVSNPAEAAMLLGLDTIMSLVLSIHVFSKFTPGSVRGFSAEALWSHSMRVGRWARVIAKAETRDRKLAEDSFTAGLLHDVGRLILAVTLPRWYEEALAQAESEGVADTEAELSVFGTTHAEVGGYLLGLWGLPDSIVEAVAFHHQPTKCPAMSFTPLTAVHAADYFEHLSAFGRARTPVAPDTEYLAQLGFDARLAVWQELCEKEAAARD